MRFSLRQYLRSSTPRSSTPLYASHASASTPIPGEKDSSGIWNTKGHSKRLIEINEDYINSLANSNQKNNDNCENISPKLPQPYSRTSIEFTNTVRSLVKRFWQIKGFDSSLGLAESGAQKAGLIKKQSDFASGENATIITGVNISICNPIYKSAMEICTHHSHYWPIQSISEEYTKPRTIYQQICSKDEISSKDKLFGRYRISVPRQIDPNTERTIQPCLIPPNWTHIDGIISLTFDQNSDLLIACGLLSSTIYDYFVKTSGASNFLRNTIESLPYPETNDLIRKEINTRVLLLNCVNSLYCDLIDETLPSFECNNYGDLIENSTLEIPQQWKVIEGQHGKYFRGSDLARNLALMEIDVLSAMAAGISQELFFGSINEGFPILTKNLENTFFDSKEDYLSPLPRQYQALAFKKKMQTTSDGKKH